MIAKLLAALKANPEVIASIIGDDEGFDIDGVQSQWDDTNNILHGHENKIAEMTAAADEAQKQISDLKSKNYDLLMSVGSNNTNSNNDDDEDDADDSVGIEDLIVDKEK